MKRLIFAVLHAGGSYMLSRNFRLQRIGDLEWLLTNYRLPEVSAGLDELMILNVATDRQVDPVLLSHVGRISRECFIPVTVGGGIRSVSDAERLLEVGADKVLLNEPFLTDPKLCEQIANRFGSQFVVQGVDVIGPDARGGLVVRGPDGYGAGTLPVVVDRGRDAGAGELLLQSVERDGTGQGLAPELLDLQLPALQTPLILMGGVGRSSHLRVGYESNHVDAIATANILNFIGNAFVDARAELIRSGIPLPIHSSGHATDLRGSLRAPA